jgi:hypothetical protein
MRAGVSRRSLSGTFDARGREAGHQWEIFWMDPVAVEQGPSAVTAA